MRATSRGPSVNRVDRGLVGDGLLGVGAALSVSLISAQIEPSGDERAIDALAIAYIVVAGGALAARRRWPLPTVGVVTAALALYLGSEYVGGPVFVTLFIALYSLSTTRDR